MKAIIIAGGEGTRLKPVSGDTPKPFVPPLRQARYGAYCADAELASELSAAAASLIREIENRLDN